MSNKIIEPSIKLPKIEVDKNLLESIKNQYDIEKQVVLFCSLYLENEFLFSRVRIRNSTYLQDKNSRHTSELIEVFNISMYPIWTPIFSYLNFVCVFSGLPKSCRIFEMVEPVKNGFFTNPINRNSEDIYHVNINF